MALDASSTPTIVQGIPPRGMSLLTVNGYDTDASTAIDIISAPGAGKSIYIIAFLITSDDADAHPQLQDGDGTVIFGPIYSTVEGMVVSKRFYPFAIKVTANKALAIKAAAAGNVSVWVEYAIAEAN